MYLQCTSSFINLIIFSNVHIFATLEEHQKTSALKHNVITELYKFNKEKRSEEEIANSAVVMATKLSKYH